MAIADPASANVAAAVPGGIRRAKSGTASEHQNALDGLRAIAAAAVLIADVAGATGFAFSGSPASWAATRGDVGVPIFFALSGFLLYRPWAVAALGQTTAPGLGGYLRRRALRILPVYWIVVAAALVLFSASHIRSAWTWAQYLLLLQNYDPHPWWAGTAAAGLGQVWSLPVDASFYVLLPLLAVLLAAVAGRGQADTGARARRLLAGIAVLGLSSYGFLVLAYRPGAAMPWLGITLPAFLSWFAVGMALAVVASWADADGEDGPVRTFGRTVASSALPCLLIAVVLFVIAATPVAGQEGIGIPGLWQAEIKTLLYTAIAVAVLAPATCQQTAVTRASAWLGHPVMKFLARISYGVFLWQGIVILELFQFFHLKQALEGGTFTTLGSVVVLVAVALATGVTATAGYYVVERPALILAHRNGSRRSGTDRAGPQPGQAGG